MYLGPCRPTQRKMDIVGNESANIVRLAVTAEMFVECETYALRNLDLHWTMTVWETLESSRRLGEIIPKIVAARRCMDRFEGQECEVWSPPRTRDGTCRTIMHNM